MQPDSAKRQDDGSFLSQDAKVVLEWASEPDDPDASYELQQSQDPSFADAVTRYSGTDRATVLTGLAEGTYHFRVRSATGADQSWSDPLQVEVRFMEPGKFFLFLGAGFVVVVMTLGAILHGHLSTSES